MMANTALDTQTDSGKPMRACKWCGKDISHRGQQAKYCNRICGQRAWVSVNRDKSRSYSARWKSANNPNTGPFQEARKCEVCSSPFIAKTSTRLFCSTACKEKKRYELHNESRKAAQRKMRKDNLERVRAQELAGYYRMKEQRPDDWEVFCKKAAAASKRWRKRDPDYARSTDLSWRRTRAAERALAMILLPATPAPKV